ncbi:thioesterase family protein, partial [Actinomadura adrarensis]
MGHVFDSDTEVTRRPDGAYGAQITDRWNGLHGMPLGSYGLAISIRALAEHMALRDPLSVSAHFLRPVEVGPAEVHTEHIRSGRRMATGQASLSQNGKERLRAIATFTDLGQFDGRTSLLGERPQLPPPEECVDPLDGVALPNISGLERVDYRMAEAPGWLRGAPGGTSVCNVYMRFREERELDPLALLYFWDAMAPVVLDMGEAPSTTVEATAHVRCRPASGWLA